MNVVTNQFRVLMALVSLLSVQACTTIVQTPMPDDPSYAPVLVSETRVSQTVKTGSIYSSGRSVSLFEDNRAHRVGDILTVILSENTSSSKTAETDISKTSSISIEEPTVLGKGVSIGKGFTLGVSVDQDRTFAGGSESDQSNQLQGSITVTVAEVLPNGLLVVRGEKWMTLNSGEEYIRVRGLVRPEDVQPNNTVQSTKLGDARIAYSGTGDFADSNKQGWASKFFSSVLWPF